jgi:aryl-alcohol dehydrogenase-like predicted oxidoreductase
LQTSELVFGGGWVGGILIHQDDDTKRAALRKALDGGINWIDTAGDYGQGQSEVALGSLLAELDPAERPHISTDIPQITPKLRTDGSRTGPILKP